MADLLTEAWCKLLDLQILGDLGAELLEVIDELGECLCGVALEVSKIYEDTLFLGL